MAEPIVLVVEWRDPEGNDGRLKWTTDPDLSAFASLTSVSKSGLISLDSFDQAV